MRYFLTIPLCIPKKPGTRLLLKKEKDKIVLQALPSFTQKLAGLTGGAIGKDPKGAPCSIALTPGTQQTQRTPRTLRTQRTP
jgi:hypothetical protein